MEVHNEEQYAVVSIGTYVQHFERELCTNQEYADARHVYKIIGKKEEEGKLYFNLEKRFGNYESFFILADELFAEVDHERYPFIKQKFVYEEVTKAEPRYPLHPEDSKYLPIYRFEDGKYNASDIIEIPIVTKNEYKIHGIDVSLKIDDDTRQYIKEDFNRKISRGVAFVTLPSNWNEEREYGLASANRIALHNKIDVNDIIGNVIELSDNHIKVKILHPGPFNRLFKEKEKIQVYYRVAKLSSSMSYKTESLELVSFDLNIPPQYVVLL